MVSPWRTSLGRPVQKVKRTIDKAWKQSLGVVAEWAEKDLVDALVYGGYGIQGIAQTEFYAYISSQQGLSELGIEKTDPQKLLDAYKRTLKIKRGKNGIEVKFGNSMTLKMATPHPHAGVKNLHVTSWMEFVLDGVVANSGFVPRARLPKKAQDKIRVQSAPGGLMLPAGAFGSKGRWRVPSHLIGYEKKWLRDNKVAIEKAILSIALKSLRGKLGRGR